MEASDDRKLLRYSIALTVCLLAVAARILLIPLLDSYSPLITFYPAIVFSALLCGVGPGLFATGASLVLSIITFVVFPEDFQSTPSVLFFQSLVLAAVGGLTAWMASGHFPIRPLIEGPRGNPEVRAKKSEAALKAHKSFFEAIQRVSGVGVWELTFSTNETEWSDGVYDLLRVEKGSAAIHEIWASVVDENDLKDSAKKLAGLIAERRTAYEFDFRATRGDGTCCYLASRGEIEYGADGNAVRLVGVNFDVTSTKLAELQIKTLNKELSKKVLELQAVLDIAPVGIAFAPDATGQVVVPNVALGTMIGVAPGVGFAPSPQDSAEEASGPKFFRNSQPLSEWDLPIRKAMMEKRPIFDEEVQVVRADGKRLVLLCSSAPIFDDEGNVISAVSAQIDISDHRRQITELEEGIKSEKSMRQDAETLNRIKDEFLAMVSHELRTPLNAIIGWVSLLIADNAAEEIKTRGLKAIELSARAQSMMIDDLLDVSRIIAGKLRIGNYFLDMIPLFDSVVDTVRPAAAEKHIELSVSIDPDLGKIAGDADRIKQILWNLASNAIKFTPDGGRVDLTLDRVDSFARIVVRDTGCGIKSEFLPFVFDRFMQEDGSLTRRYTGLGLGLSITKSLVELHGGTITAQSAGVGKGSTFTVQIPLVPDTVVGVNRGRFPKSGAGTEKPTGNELNGARILVVDDDPDSREVVKIFLEQHGALVDTASSVAEAFDKFKGNGFRMIVSDIGMPDEDGFQLVRRIRDFEGGACRIPIVALTAYARSEDRHAAMEAGFDEHVPKPVEPDALIAAASRLLRAR